jgi:uncharacterized OB-fold protein
MNESVFQTDSDGNLLGSRCDTCSSVACPPRPYHCDSPTREVALAPFGNIEFWTTINVAPSRFRPPYKLAVVRLQGRARVLARIEPSDLGIDQIKGREVQLLVPPHATCPGETTPALIAHVTNRL